MGEVFRLGRVQPDGRITLPKEIVQRAGLAPGDEVMLDIAGDAFLLRRPPQPQESASMPDQNLDLRAQLQRVFGFQSFRPQQEQIIRSVLSGEPTLGIMPTSAGKSLCYQLPALLLPGMTLVVSPLIALMKDQVDSLRRRGISALAIHSGMERADLEAAHALMAGGKAKIVFVAPERLRNREFLAVLERARIDLLAVDEAHCLSQWGHDFRPDYRLISMFQQKVRAPRTVALTATAPPTVQRDIVDSLGITKVIVGQLDRPNLRYGVIAVASEAERQREVIARLRALQGGAAVLYAPTRAATEHWAELLAVQLGTHVRAYHAGMPPDARVAVHNAFMSGEAPIIVATTAFGMGVDKPDIRAVIHLGLPDSVEAYSQEVGRAGRDGQPAWALVISILGYDLRMRRQLLEREKPNYSWLRRKLQELEAVQVGTRFDIGAAAEDELPQATLLVSLLAEQGIASAGGRRREAESITLQRRVVHGDVETMLSDMEARRRSKLRRFDSFSSYLGSSICRREFLASYFSAPEASSKPEVCCDRCHPDAFGTRVTSGRAISPAPARRRAATPVDVAVLGPEGRELLQALRNWRRHQAIERGVPAYVIASDKTLQAIARVRPATAAQLLAVPGIGEQRLEAFGSDILAVVEGMRAGAS